MFMAGNIVRSLPIVDIKILVYRRLTLQTPLAKLAPNKQSDSNHISGMDTRCLYDTDACPWQLARCLPH